MVVGGIGYYVNFHFMNILVTSVVKGYLVVTDLLCTMEEVVERLTKRLALEGSKVEVEVVMPEKPLLGRARRRFWLVNSCLTGILKQICWRAL